MIDKLSTTETSLTSSPTRGKELKNDSVEFICGDDKMLCRIKLLTTKKIHLIITKDFDLSCWELETDCEELRQKDPHWSSFDIEQVYCIIVEGFRENKFVFEIETQFARLEIIFQIVSVKFNLKIEIPEKKSDHESIVSLQGEHIRKLLKHQEILERVIEQLQNKHPKKVFLLTSSSWKYNQANWADFPDATGQVELKQGKFYKWDLLINGLCSRYRSDKSEAKFRLFLQSDDKTDLYYQPSEAGFKKCLRSSGNYDHSVQGRNTLTVDKSAIYTIQLQVCPAHGIDWDSAYGITSLFIEEI